MTQLAITVFDVNVLGRTIDGEAENQPDQAKLGVAFSAINRAKLGTFPGGHSVAGVCLAHRQYDCWDHGSKDFARMIALPEKDKNIRACTAIAFKALKTGVADPTKGAVFYHDWSLDEPPSAWGDVHLTATIGHLKFYAQGKAPRSSSEAVAQGKTS